MEFEYPLTQPQKEFPASLLQAGRARRRHDLLPKRATNASLPHLAFLPPSLPLSAITALFTPSLHHPANLISENALPDYGVLHGCDRNNTSPLPFFPTPPLSASVRIWSTFPRAKMEHGRQMRVSFRCKACVTTYEMAGFILLRLRSSPSS